MVAISSIHNAVRRFQSISIQNAVSAFILSARFMFVRTFHRDATIIARRSIEHQKMTKDLVEVSTDLQ